MKNKRLRLLQHALALNRFANIAQAEKDKYDWGMHFYTYHGMHNGARFFKNIPEMRQLVRKITSSIKES